jgi:hypothetical protein
MIIKTVAGAVDNTEAVNGSELSASESGIVNQYKEVIREQDRKLAASEASRITLESHRQHLEARLEELSSKIALLSDENMILRAQVCILFVKKIIRLQKELDIPSVL